MSEPYRPPDADLIPDSEVFVKPRRLLVDLTFWITHAGVFLYLIKLADPVGATQSPGLMAILIVIAFVSAVAYIFVIGWYAARMGRSGVIWGGLTFLFSPFSIWISYIASFFLRPAARKVKGSEGTG